MNQRSGLRVRLTTEDDLPEVCNIINHFIENSFLNFRTEPQGVDEWFVHVGRLVEAGYKLGAWRDVGFWQRTFNIAE